MGVGRYIPKRVVTSEELEEKYGVEPGWCQKKVGILERHWAEDESIAYMCTQAIKEACEDAQVKVSEIDYMINAGNSFDKVMPDENVQIMKICKEFRSDIPYISINCGCLSFLAALDTASIMLSNGNYQRILITSGILASPMIDYSESEEKYTMGDAGVAVIVTRASENEASRILSARMETYSEHSGVKGFNAIEHNETPILFNKKVLSKGISFEFNTKEMQSRGMEYNKEFLSRLCPCSRRSINRVIPNQSSRFVSDMLRITFSSEKIKTIIDRFGNIGAAGHAMALYELIKIDHIERGEVVLLQAMGAGFSIYGILLVY